MKSYSDSIIAKRIPYSPLRVMFDAAAEIEKSGRKLVHMEIGRPDFETPAHIVEAAVKALRGGQHHYCPTHGIIELREAISQKYINEYGINYSPATDILVTNGVAEGIFVAMAALLDPGEQVLIPDPIWMCYDTIPVMNFAEPVPYTLREENGFQPDFEELESLITPRTKMICVVSPSNPTGAVLNAQSLQKIAQIAEKYDLFVLSDEIYEKIIYPPAAHTCFASLDGMRERTIVLNGFAKYYSMTGWRLGYAVGPQKPINAMIRYHQYMLTSVTTFSQFGAIAALAEDPSPSVKMLEEFKKRRDYFADALSEVEGFDCPLPDGAFYLFPSIKGTGLSSQELAFKLLNEAGVVCVSGDVFGKHGKDHLRFSYTCSLDDLKIAAENIKKIGIRD
ncbi:MAG: pyridoxal phosphate-dependent aminotransferase [Synergistaceae bacterium]|nr:pyridoxal phosphate-dependent aminotransferase [Synergistaceae bacterium]